MNKISVIVPFYNSERTLNKCINSILAQTYKNFEVIFVSDGSSDRSCKIINKFMKKDNRIKLIVAEHKGVSNARNIGLENVTGDYIEFVDSDDFMEKNMFERLMETALAYNADMVSCNFYHPFFNNYIGNRVLDFTKKEDALLYYQTTFAAQIPWNKLYKKEVITEKFEVGVAFCEDGLFFLANMTNLKTVVTIDDKLYHYYVAPKAPGKAESCISSIANADDFYITKNTFWYKRDKLLGLSKEILKNKRPQNDIDDFAYVRIFDFMIWEMHIFLSSGCEVEPLTYDIINIFNEKDFIAALDNKKKFGVSLKKLSQQEKKNYVEQYVMLCAMAYKNITSAGLSLKPFYVYLDFFVELFVSCTAMYAVDTTDFLAEEIIHVKNQDTEESRFVTSFLDMYSEENNFENNEELARII